MPQRPAKGPNRLERLHRPWPRWSINRAGATCFVTSARLSLSCSCSPGHGFPNRRPPLLRRPARFRCASFRAPAPTGRRWKRRDASFARTAARRSGAGAAGAGSPWHRRGASAMNRFEAGMPACLLSPGGRLPAPTAPCRRGCCTGRMRCAACPGEFGHPVETPESLISSGYRRICRPYQERRPWLLARRASDVAGGVFP